MLPLGHTLGRPRPKVTGKGDENAKHSRKTSGFFVPAEKASLQAGRQLIKVILMRTHRFFISQEPKKYAVGNQISITDKILLNQWSNVFRMKEGSQITALDNSGYEYDALILNLDKNEAKIEIVKKTKNTAEPESKLTLYQAVIKKDNFEWIVEKCTELGISKIVPVLAERSEKKNLNLERLRIIAKEASEQSGRGVIPKIHAPISLGEALTDIKPSSCIAFDSSGPSFPAKSLQLIANSSPSSLPNSSQLTANSPSSSPSLLPNSSKLTAKSFFIGPEGGWSEKELIVFRDHKIAMHSLGKTTLRAETAAIVATTLLMIT
jgi:16S rRNA (uracil1498-N3)-methyltransferase